MIRNKFQILEREASANPNILLISKLNWTTFLSLEFLLDGFSKPDR